MQKRCYTSGYIIQTSIRRRLHDCDYDNGTYPWSFVTEVFEQLIRSCVFWEANVWSSSRTNKRTRIENTLFEVCLVRIKAQVLRTPCLNLNLNLNVWCLTPLSIIFQLYHGDQFQWWKPEYPERTTDPGQATGKLYHLQVRVECILFVI